MLSLKVIWGYLIRLHDKFHTIFPKSLKNQIPLSEIVENFYFFMCTDEGNDFLEKSLQDYPIDQIPAQGWPFIPFISYQISIINVSQDCLHGKLS